MTGKEKRKLVSSSSCYGPLQDEWLRHRGYFTPTKPPRCGCRAAQPVCEEGKRLFTLFLVETALF